MKYAGAARLGAGFVLAVVGLFGAASATSAATIVSHSSTWEHTFTDPTGDATWNTTTGLGGIWSSGDAPFSNVSSGDFANNTFWPADGRDGDDLWVRVAVDLTGFDLSTVEWGLGSDNGFKLFANGDLIAQDNAEGFTSRWEYSGDFASSLVQGVNVIAVALEDHGGLTAFDMQITGEPVPEPGTFAIWSLLGGVGVVAWRRRRCQQAA